MMDSVAIIQADTGMVLRLINCPADMAAAQASEGETVLLNPPAEVQADGRWQWNGETFEQAAESLDMLKAAKRADLALIASERLNLWVSGNLQVDDTSTARINAWATQALVSKATGSSFDLPFWIMADNSHRTFADADDFLAFASAAGAYKTSAVLQNSALKAAITSATDATELAAINVTEGWPA